MRRRSTLSESEKTEREERRLVKKAPKKKPPRKDTKRNRVNDSDSSDKDPDKEQDKKDTSKNYKDAVYRVALKYIVSKESEMVSVKRKDDGKVVNVSEDTLKGPDKSLYEEIDEGEEETEVEEDIVEEDVEEEDPKPTRSERQEKDFQENLETLDSKYRVVPKEEIEEVLEELDWGGKTIKEDIAELEELLESRVQEIYEEDPRKETEDIIRNEVADVPTYIVNEALAKIKEETGIDTDDIENLNSSDLDVLMEEVKSFKQNYGKGRVKTEDTEIANALSDLSSDFEKTLPKSVVDKYLSQVDRATPEEFKKIRRQLEKEEKKEDKLRAKVKKEQAKKLQETPSKERQKRKEQLEKKRKPSAEEVRELLSIDEFEKMLEDPLERIDDLPEEGAKADPSTQETALRERATSTFNAYKNSESGVINSNLRKLTDSLKDMDPTDARTQEVMAMVQGLRFAEHYAKGQEGKSDETPGMGSATAQIIEWAMKSGGTEVEDLMYAELAGGDSPANAKAQEIVHKTLQKVTDEEWINLVPEGHPARALAELLADEDPKGKGRFLSEQDREFIREQISYVMGADASYGDPANVSEDPDATVGENRKKTNDLHSGMTGAPNIDDYSEGEMDKYREDVDAFRSEYESGITEPFRNTDNSDVIDFSAEAEKRRKEQERELERQRKEQEKSMNPDEARARRREEIEMRRYQKPSDSGGGFMSDFKRYAKNNFSINSLYHNIIGNRTYIGEINMRKVSKRQVRELTRAMDEMATTIQKMARQLGIPNKVAMDFALRTDLISDAIEKNANFDPNEIGEVVGGPLEQLDSDEPWMNDHFTAIEGEELLDMQESGSFSNAKAASRRRRRASRRLRANRR